MDALIYTRVSKNPNGRSRSPAEQEAECRAVCDREGWRIADVLSDAGRSASRYATRGRPAWQDVKRRIAGDGISVLVTWEASRNARDLAEFVELRDLLRANGVLLSYSGRTYDLADSRDWKIVTRDAVDAEGEAEDTRDRILRNVRANAQAGRPHGRRLYGYRYVYDDDTPPKLLRQEPEPAEAAIVREVARRYLAGESTYAIAADLNARAVPLPTGAAWSETRIKRVLTNPSYVAKRVHRGQVVGDADWPPILDDATFDALAARYEDPARAKYRGGHDLKHLLSGIARCGLCGARLYRGHDRKRRDVYVCKKGGGHLTRSMAHLDAYVTAILLDKLATLDLDDLTAEAPEARKARAEAAKLRRRLDKAVAKFTAGELSANVLAKVEADLEPKIADAERRARAVAVPPLVIELAGEGVDARWDRLTVEQCREVVRVLLHVTVLPAKRPHGTRGFDPDAVRLEWR